MASLDVVKRNKFADYLMVGSDYVLMGVGFTKLAESPNAKGEAVVYVNEETSSYSIDSYETEFAYDSHLIKSQEATMALYLTGRDHHTGSDAEFTMIRVELFRPVGATGTEFLARKFIVANEVKDSDGESGGKVTVSGVLHSVGDFEDGKFDTTSKTFTAGTFTSP